MVDAHQKKSRRVLHPAAYDFTKLYRSSSSLINQFQERLDHAWVKMLSGLLLDILQHFPLSPSLPIGAITR